MFLTRLAVSVLVSPYNAITNMDDVRRTHHMATLIVSQEPGESQLAADSTSKGWALELGWTLRRLNILVPALVTVALSQHS
jgi:hypothetical protein